MVLQVLVQFWVFRWMNGCMEGQQNGKVRWSNKLISYSYLNMPIHTVKKVHEEDGGEKLRLGPVPFSK